MGFGDIHGPKPYTFIGLGETHGPKPYKFIRLGDIHGPKPYKFIGLEAPSPWFLGYRIIFRLQPGSSALSGCFLASLTHRRAPDALRCCNSPISAVHWHFGILIFVDFWRFSAKLGPKTPLERRGSSCSAGCTKNQPPRPILRAFRGNSEFGIQCVLFRHSVF